MPYTNEDIIDTLYRLYEQSMYFEAYKILHDEYLAEDAVHEAFLRLIRNRSKITAPESSTARGYIYKTLKTATLDLYRKQKKIRENCLVLDETIENTYAEEESDTRVPLSMIENLPKRYASVMRCLFYDGLNIRETASVLQISEVCVRKRYERAKKLLKDKLNISKKETHDGNER